MGPNILFYPEDNYRYLFNSLLLTFIFIENYELLRLILSALFSSAKVLRRGNAKYRYAGCSANGLVDLITTFRNFRQA